MKKAIILIIEDNLDVIYNLEMTLKFNGYETLTAINGLEGLKILEQQKILPDLIISDIMMPEMDGYEFFSSTMQNETWKHIPFIFLTARSSPNDVRLGKKLGVDDYIIKPFESEDLLASIEGKLNRLKMKKELQQKIVINSPRLDSTNDITEINTEHNITLFWMVWDENKGPKIKEVYSKGETNYSMQEIGLQLFQSSVALYGYTSYSEPQDLLLPLKNLNLDSYIFFDSVKDSKVRGEEKQIMIAILAPKITYMTSLKLNTIFMELTQELKKNFDSFQISTFYNKVSEVLL